jgi:hypothetical protein
VDSVGKGDGFIAVTDPRVEQVIKSFLFVSYAVISLVRLSNEISDISRILCAGSGLPDRRGPNVVMHTHSKSLNGC